MTNSLSNISVKRIAFLNPYLPGGHVQTAEIESTQRLLQAGKNLNIDIRVFGSCEEVEVFNPDFLLTISFQAPKLTRFPTYGLLDVPISLIKDVPRFVRNILSYDGYFTISQSSIDWLITLCQANNKSLHLAHAGVSLPQVDFVPADYKNAVAMYIGTNWDGQRHQKLFSLLESGTHVKCFGPKKSWQNSSPSLYAGEVPFDGVSVIRQYRQCGAGLCIGHPVFDNEGVPSSRTFEIAAASAIPICSDIELNRRIYGDHVLYVDHNVETSVLVKQIVDAVEWIRHHPDAAYEMAHAANTIFNQQLCMEQYLKNIITMHEKVLEANHYVPVAANTPTSTVYVCPVKQWDEGYIQTLNDLATQTQLVDVLLLTPSEVSLPQITTVNGSFLKVKQIIYYDYKDNWEIFSYLFNHYKWMGWLNLGSRIFPNHTATLLNNQKELNEIASVHAGNLEYSNRYHLPERLNDPHFVINQNRIRVAFLMTDLAMPLSSFLIQLPIVGRGIFHGINFYTDNDVFVSRLITLGNIKRYCEITSALNIDYVFDSITSDEINKIENEDTMPSVESKQHTRSLLEEILKHLNHEIYKLNQKISDQAEELHHIQSSRSWVYTTPFRKFARKMQMFKRKWKPEVMG